MKRRTDTRPRHADALPPPDPDALLTTEEAAPRVRLSPRTLERYRVTGGGPEFLKVGRLVFYQRKTLDAWLETKRRRSTSDPGKTKTKDQT